MRISDWSSDVCSSDLSLREHRPPHQPSSVPPLGPVVRALPDTRTPARSAREPPGLVTCEHTCAETFGPRAWTYVTAPRTSDFRVAVFAGLPEIGRASCRERVSQYV